MQRSKDSIFARFRKQF